MITVRLHPNFLLALLTQGRVMRPLRVRTGLPDGSMLVGCRFDQVRDLALLDFIDGQPGHTEVEVVFDVGAEIVS